MLRQPKCTLLLTLACAAFCILISVGWPNAKAQSSPTLSEKLGQLALDQGVETSRLTQDLPYLFQLFSKTKSLESFIPYREDSLFRGADYYRVTSGLAAQNAPGKDVSLVLQHFVSTDHGYVATHFLNQAQSVKQYVEFVEHAQHHMHLYLLDQALEHSLDRFIALDPAPSHYDRMARIKTWQMADFAEKHKAELAAKQCSNIF